MRLCRDVDRAPTFVGAWTPAELEGPASDPTQALKHLITCKDTCNIANHYVILNRGTLMGK